MAINRWLAGAAMLAAVALPAVVALPTVSAVLASNGEIVIGTNATNGDIHVNTLAPNNLRADQVQGNVPTCVSAAAPDTCPPDN